MLNADRMHHKLLFRYDWYFPKLHFFADLRLIMHLTFNIMQLEFDIYLPYYT